ncbi:MAG: hypothetical protein WCY11_05445 [Novosphingobium sp.]
MDSRGRLIKVGVEAKILTIPEWLTHDLPSEEVVELKTADGQLMKVLEVDEYGYVWFGTDNVGRWFCLRPSEIMVVG